MKKVIAASILIVAIAMFAWFGLPKVIDATLHSEFETHIAGDYYQIATSDTYREIYNKKTGFSIPVRIEPIRSDAEYIVAIKKQKTNLNFHSGPCEYYLINHLQAIEHPKLSEKEVRDFLQHRPDLYRSFEAEKNKQCNDAP